MVVVGDGDVALGPHTPALASALVLVVDCAAVVVVVVDVGVLVQLGLEDVPDLVQLQGVQGGLVTRVQETAAVVLGGRGREAGPLEAGHLEVRPGGGHLEVGGNLAGAGGDSAGAAEALAVAQLALVAAAALAALTRVELGWRAAAVRAAGPDTEVLQIFF